MMLRIDVGLVKDDPIMNQASIRAELIIRSLNKIYSVLALGWNRGEGTPNKPNLLDVFSLSAPYGCTLRYLALLPMFWTWVFLVYSIFVTQFKDSKLFPETVLLIISITTILIMIILCSLQSRFALYQSALYGFGASIAGCIFSYAYAVGLFKAIGKAPIKWRQ